MQHLFVCETWNKYVTITASAVVIVEGHTSFILSDPAQAGYRQRVKRGGIGAVEES